MMKSLRTQAARRLKTPRFFRKNGPFGAKNRTLSACAGKMPLPDGQTDGIFTNFSKNFFELSVADGEKIWYYERR